LAVVWEQDAFSCWVAG